MALLKNRLIKKLEAIGTSVREYQPRRQWHNHSPEEDHDHGIQLEEGPDYEEVGVDQDSKGKEDASHGQD